MTDRELLEAAAKAEGHAVAFDASSGLVFWGDKFFGILWNPLHNDGDALRLAVKLRLDIGHGKEHTYADSEQINGPCISELDGADPYAATRRAIVRAAAAAMARK